MTKPQPVYCDESGFTGSNLLSKEQPYFAYSGVAVSTDEARHIIDEARARHALHAQELKAKSLLGSAKGRLALADMLILVSDRSRVIVCHKKFSLACHFFEWVFEPLIAERSVYFYRSGFHRFIANILFREIERANATAEAVFVEFERAMRTRDTAGLEKLLCSNSRASDGEWLTQILEFCELNQKAIQMHLKSLDGNGADKWLLDLSLSALFTILTEFAPTFDSMDVTCDRSKPLKVGAPVLSAMIGRTTKRYFPLDPRRRMDFNLAGPIKHGDSKTEPALQLADLVAGAGAWLFGRADPISESRLDRAIVRMLSHACVVPDTESIDVNDHGVIANGLVLEELVARSRQGKSLTYQVGRSIARCQQRARRQRRT